MISLVYSIIIIMRPQAALTDYEVAASMSPIRFIVVVVFALVAGWLALPSRNERGNPSMETEIGRCTTSSGTTLRLYQGNGGATTAYWYTLTSASGFFSPERQILFAYSSPEFESISCEGDGASLGSGASVEHLSSAVLTQLRQTPRMYSRGQEERGSLSVQPLAAIRYGAAALLASLSLWFACHPRRLQHSGENAT